jgi:hypothetical protein
MGAMSLGGSTSLRARSPHGATVLMGAMSLGARPPYALAILTALQSSWAPRPYGLSRLYHKSLCYKLLWCGLSTLYSIVGSAVVARGVLLRSVMVRVVVLQNVVRSAVVLQNVMGSAVVALSFSTANRCSSNCSTTQCRKISRCGSSCGGNISPARSGEQSPCLGEGPVLGPISLPPKPRHDEWMLVVKACSIGGPCTYRHCNPTRKGLSNSER